MTFQNLNSSTSGPAVPAGGKASTTAGAVLEVNQEEVARTYLHTKRVGNYLLGKTIGEGSFAKVKEGVHVLSGEKVAVKIIDKKKAREDAYVRRNMRREGRLLQLVRHRNVIQLFETLETENSYYLVTEYCGGGDLMTRICTRRRLDEPEARKYVRQISSAVDYLHKAGIIHRDLKVENLLLDETKNIKIIDFGLSNSFRMDDSADGSGSVTALCVTQCGSPAYAAPELLSNAKYGPEIDVWSIGVNMYAMLTGNLPFTVEPFTIKALHSKMVNGDMNPLPDQLSKGCRDLLKRFLTADPEKRIGLSEAIGHPWLTEKLNRAIEEAPFPNRLTAMELNQTIVRHMATRLDFKLGDVIRHVTSNIPSSATATYHLLHHRMIRYAGAKRPASGLLRRDAQHVGQMDLFPPPPPPPEDATLADQGGRLKATSPDPGTSGVGHVTPSPSSSAVNGSGDGKPIDRNISGVGDDFPVDSTRKPEPLRDGKSDDVTGEMVTARLGNSVDSGGDCNDQSNSNKNVRKASVILLKRQSDPGDCRGNDSRHLPNNGLTASLETDIATSEDKENNVAKTTVTPTKTLKNGRRKQELDDVRFHRRSLATKTRTSTPNAQKPNVSREEILDLSKDRSRNSGRPASRQNAHEKSHGSSDLPLLPPGTIQKTTNASWTTPLRRTTPDDARPKPSTPRQEEDHPPARHPPRRHLQAAAAAKSTPLGYGPRSLFRYPLFKQEVTSGPETVKRYLIDVDHYERYARCDERGALYCHPRPHTWRLNHTKPLTSQPNRGQVTERRTTFASRPANGTRSVDRKIQCDNRRSFGNDPDLLTLQTDNEQDHN